MSRTCLVTAAVLALACATPAQGHQLDEYVQAARIGLEPERIIVEMSLTPGAAVARKIFSSLDGDGDGRISAPEARGYAQTVLSDLVFEVDDQSRALRLLRAQLPSWPEMREGVGTIRLQAEAGVVLSRGRHRLRFVNNHRPEISVYLVNALMPTSAIVIRSQQRDVRQHGIVLEFDRSSSDLGALWIVFPLVAVTAIVFYRRHQVESGFSRTCAVRL